MTLGLRPRAIMATLRPIPRPYHYKQSLTYNDKLVAYVTLDFRKAFGVLSHDIILKKENLHYMAVIS